MNYFYQNISSKWAQMTICKQMANIGIEFDRAIRWRKKDKKLSLNAFYRSILLLDETINDKKNLHRLKEICRLKEIMIDYFLGDNIYQSDEKFFQKYFLFYNFIVYKNR